jgi:hypothetical protein
MYVSTNESTLDNIVNGYPKQHISVINGDSDSMYQHWGYDAASNIEDSKVVSTIRDSFLYDNYSVDFDSIDNLTDITEYNVELLVIESSNVDKVSYIEEWAIETETAVVVLDSNPSNKLLSTASFVIEVSRISSINTVDSLLYLRKNSLVGLPSDGAAKVFSIEYYPDPRVDNKNLTTVN